MRPYRPVRLAAAPAAAQRPAQEFTRQELLVTNFEAGAGADVALGDRVSELLRERLERVLDRREVDVTQTGELRNELPAR